MGCQGCKVTGRDCFQALQSQAVLALSDSRTCSQLQHQVDDQSGVVTSISATTALKRLPATANTSDDGEIKELLGKHTSGVLHQLQTQEQALRSAFRVHACASATLWFKNTVWHMQGNARSLGSKLCIYLKGMEVQTTALACPLSLHIANLPQKAIQLASVKSQCNSYNLW